MMDGPIPEHTLIDTAHVLYIGEMLNKAMLLTHTLARHRIEPEELNHVVIEHCDDDCKLHDEHVPDAVESVTQALHGDRATAELFIDVYRMGFYQGLVMEALSNRKDMQSVKTEEMKELRADIDKTLNEGRDGMKCMVAKLSERSPSIAGIAVDSYVGTLSEHLGLNKNGRPVG